MIKQTNGRIRLITGTISTDDIIPGKYKHMYTDLGILAGHVFENSHPELNRTLEAGDILWSRDIFGIGSSREQAPSSLAARGVRAVIAPRFGRIFYRNAWNVGLPVLATDLLPEAQDEGSPVELDWEAGRLTLTRVTASFPPPPDHLRDIAGHGGLIAMLKQSHGNLEALRA